MSTFKPDEHLSSLLRMVGGAAGSNLSSKAPDHHPQSKISDYATVTMLEELKAHLLGHIREEIGASPGGKLKTFGDIEVLKKLEEKCDVILVKLPILESRTEEVATLRRELEGERAKKNKSMEGMAGLMWEVRQLSLKVKGLEGKIQKMEEEKKKGEDDAAVMASPTPVMEPMIPVRASESLHNLVEEAGEIQNENGSLNEAVDEVMPEETTATPGIHPQAHVIEGPSPLRKYLTPDKPSSRMRMPTKFNMMTRSSGRNKVTPSSCSSELDPAPNTVTYDAACDALTTLTTCDKVETDDAQPRQPNWVSMGVIHGESPVTGRFLKYSCLCGLEFDTERSISEHVREETGQGTSSPRVDKVKSETTAAPALVEHLEDPSRPLHCLCGIECRDSLALSQHIGYYANRKYFPCKSCGKRFVFAIQLKVHIKRVHTSNLSSRGRLIQITPTYSKYKKGRADRYKCHPCGVSFSNAKKLADHRKTAHRHNGKDSPSKK